MALNYRTTALVVESWEEARSRPEFEERVGALIFRHLFEIHPRSKQAFGLRRNFDPTIENCRKQKIAIQHMCRLLRFIHLLLTMECPPELLYQTLEDCGRRHLKYNTQAQTIPLMGEAILMALQDWIGEEGWSEELQGAWSEVFDLIENRMVKGMEK